MNSWIDPIFHMLKVKFDVLDSMNVIKDKEQIFVFINLEDPFRYLINPRNDAQLKAGGCIKTDIELHLISNIINLGQHYRLYCKKQNKDCRIFLFWNYPRSNYNNRKYWAEYRIEQDKKLGLNLTAEYITRCLEESVPMLTKIIDFVNQVYVINGGEIESSLIPNIILDSYNDGVDRQNILISRQRYDYQYLQNDFTIIEPRGEKSCIIDNSNVIDHMKQQSNIKNPLTVPPSLLGFVLSLLGDTHRGIPKIPGFGLCSIIKAISTAIERNLISENSKDIDLLANILNDNYKERFKRNYHMTNFELQLNDSTPLQRDFIMSQIIDKFDDTTLNKMNEKYFLMCPIMLIDTKTEQVYRETINLYS